MRSAEALSVRRRLGDAISFCAWDRPSYGHRKDVSLEKHKNVWTLVVSWRGLRSLRHNDVHTHISFLYCDECFADLTGLPGDLDALGRRIRAAVYRCTGIPVGVGIAKTKTLAKLANHTAKRLQAETGGVVNICEPFQRDWVLRNTDVAEVWGIGRNMKIHLEGMNIKSAMDLAKADPWMLRKKFSVVIEKTARELGGTPCLELDEPDPPKQEICCSRAFGKRLKELPPIKEAVATYMMRASEKLRAQHSLCKKIRVSIRTGMFSPEEAKYANGVLVDLPYPTDDVRLLTKAAIGALDQIFRVGFNYSKAEVLLLNLCQRGEFTDDLFSTSQIGRAHV